MRGGLPCVETHFQFSYFNRQVLQRRCNQALLYVVNVTVDHLINVSDM